MRFIELIRSAARSNTIQFNGILAAVLLAIRDSEFVQSNPDYVAIVAGVAAIVNLFLRAKTKVPLSER